MIHINIIAPGRMSEKFYADAMREYEKRLSQILYSIYYKSIDPISLLDQFQ